VTGPGGDKPQEVTVHLGWWAGWKVLRLLRGVQREQWDELPPAYRPPAGKWLPGRTERAVRLEGTGPRQDTLARIVEVFREDDSDSVAAWSWLDVRPDELGVERVAVLVGTHLIGFFSSAESNALESLVRRGAKARRAVWVDTFIAREANVLVADVNLP
jgi:hypothetical protein